MNFNRTTPFKGKGFNLLRANGVVFNHWGPHALISLHDKEVPDFILEKAEVGMRAFAYVNLHEGDPMNLVFERWELGPECECGGVVFSCRPPEYMQLICDKCDEPLQDKPELGTQ